MPGHHVPLPELLLLGRRPAGRVINELEATGVVLVHPVPGAVDVEGRAELVAEQEVGELRARVRRQVVRQLHPVVQATVPLIRHGSPPTPDVAPFRGA